uniref:Uncharacterized protein n=1 Tax=Romanomermis culicivorax TaxID=13658 RepID=A0A915IT15_ROMCU
MRKLEFLVLRIFLAFGFLTFILRRDSTISAVSISSRSSPDLRSFFATLNKNLFGSGNRTIAVVNPQRGSGNGPVAETTPNQIRPTREIEKDVSDGIMQFIVDRCIRKRGDVVRCCRNNFIRFLNEGFSYPSSEK